MFDSSLNVVGKNFHELNEEEMLEIVGGTDANQRATPAIISAITKVTGSLASGFSVSWIATGAFNCKSVE